MTGPGTPASAPEDPGPGQWHPDQDGIARRTATGGNTGASGWAVRLVRDDLPGACIQVTAVVRDKDPGVGEGWRRWWPEAVVVFMTFDDPADPAGTATTYAVEHFDDHLFDYETPDAADSAAREMAEGFTRPGFFDPGATGGLPPLAPDRDVPGEEL